ncbi:MAG: hypothetical protein ACI4WF_00575 [Bacilli bacterium]
MFKDIKVFNDNETFEYNYKMDDGLLLFSIENGNKKQYDNLKIIYDENIYQINLSNNIKYKNLNASEILIFLENDTTDFSFKVNINYKFFVKTVYKFLNKFIDKDTLIKEINIFLKSKIGQKYNNELAKLLDDIENKYIPIEELMLEGNDEVNRITNLLLNNEIYITLANQMSNQDLMLLITYYIFAPMIPMIDQETFNDLVNSAIQYDYPLEKVWRLAMNYDSRGYNYDLIDEFFVNSKDSYYLAEYISGVIQVNKEKIVNMIIQTKDKEFIKALLKDNFIQNHLEEKHINDLEKLLIDEEN